MNIESGLPFEKSIVELQQKIEELRRVGVQEDLKVNIGDEIARLEEKCSSLTQQVYANLTAHQVVQVARHPQRPYTADVIEHVFTEFEELHGDRHSTDDSAIIGGTAYLDDKPVMVIGQQKGRGTKEKLRRNFGMANPEGFRKALRLMQMAEKFKMPIFTLIDTPGAYPGIAAEEHNQSEAIARNLYAMMQLKTPIICTVLGEGCSGGALAIGVGDCIMMMQYSYFSVISPEGCASILWKDAARASEAAEALNLTSQRLKQLNLIDVVIPEPEGGAHRDHAAACTKIKNAWHKYLADTAHLTTAEIVDLRYKKYMDIGREKV